MWLAVGMLLAGAVGVGADVTPSNAPGDYALLGFRSVTLRSLVQVDAGDVGCDGKNCTTTLLPRSRIAGSLASDRVRLGRNATVGQLFCTTQLEATSSTCQRMTLPLIDTAKLPAFQVNPAPGAGPVRVRPRATVGQVAAGTYDNVVVGDRGQLTLLGGDYQMRSIFIGEHARLTCQSACKLVVAERVFMKEFSQLGAVNPRDAEVDVQGGGPRAAFRATRRSIVNATVFAPNGDVVLGQGGRYTGSFIGSTVFVFQRAQVIGASDLR
jgi:hypothetical protein